VAASSWYPAKAALMRYNIAALYIAPGGLPDKMPVEVNRSGASAKTVGRALEIDGVACVFGITISQARPEGVVMVSKANVTTRISPKP
jgi:hypothetical protein